MSGVLATMERELKAYFWSPLGWVVLTGFLFFNGLGFSTIVGVLNDPRAPAGTTPLDLFFGETIFFWLAVLVLIPVITMRLIAEERKSGTIEVLMTAPVSEGQVVVGKYLGALAFYIFLWLPTALYAALLAEHLEIDWGPVAAGYLGIFGLGALLLAVGVFASSLTSNQIVAAVIGFALMFLFVIPAFLDFLVNDPALKSVLDYVNLLQHMDDFSKGIVDTRRLAFYLTTSAFFLFLSSRALESRKWR